jgi:hypothetical protein
MHKKEIQQSPQPLLAQAQVTAQQQRATGFPAFLLDIIHLHPQVKDKTNREIVMKCTALDCFLAINTRERCLMETLQNILHCCCC